MNSEREEERSMQENEKPKVDGEDMAEVCPNCNGTKFRLERREQRFLYGREGEASEIAAIVPVHTCKNCGFEFTGEGAEEARHEAICRHLRLMTPREIKALREKYEMTRAEFAELSRLGTASLARWEAGILIQNGANDQLLYLLQYEENVALLNHRELSRGRAAGRPTNEADEIAELSVDMAAQDRSTRHARRPRRCPLRGRFRLIDRPEERRAAAVGWGP
jgi:putative zinc finger/helix-turn-helix YgiT family protein